MAEPNFNLIAHSLCDIIFNTDSRGTLKIAQNSSISRLLRLREFSVGENDKYFDQLRISLSDHRALLERGFSDYEISCQESRKKLVEIVPHLDYRKLLETISDFQGEILKHQIILSGILISLIQIS